jgi:hypothetical protein
LATWSTLFPLRTHSPLSGVPVSGITWDAAMDEVTFRSDTVLSDVHLFTPNHRHLMVRLNGVGQPGKVLSQGRVAQHPVDPILFSVFSYSSFWGKGWGDWIVYLSSSHFLSALHSLSTCALLSTSCVLGPRLMLEMQTRVCQAPPSMHPQPSGGA